jgi:para-nitrobenzyl esterase
VDRRLSETMMSYWVSFATRGDPGAAGLAPWPAFTGARPVLLRLGGQIAPLAPLPADRVGLLSR